MSDALWRLGACELAEGIRAKRFSCVDVMESVVGRIRALNPELNMWQLAQPLIERWITDNLGPQAQLRSAG